MALPFYNWSRTASSNATADSTVNWSEGQAPSSVNDSGRAMMASTAAFRDDISGAIVTGGTSTAYTLTSYQVFDTLAHMNSALIAFTPHVTNGATVTLNVDGLGAKPLRPAPSVELQSNTLIASTPYTATYSNADAVWYLHNLASNTYGIPLGGGMDYWGSTAPSSAFVFPYGQAISRTTYATAFTLFSTTYGVGDGSTTFNIPDLRGRTVAGKDDMGGSAASRLTSTYFGASAASLGAVGGSESHTLTTAQLAVHSHANSLTDPQHTHGFSGFTSSSVGVNGGLVAASSGQGSAQIASNTTGISITNANAGSGNAHNNVQPTIVCNYILRVI